MLGRRCGRSRAARAVAAMSVAVASRGAWASRPLRLVVGLAALAAVALAAFALRGAVSPQAALAAVAQWRAFAAAHLFAAAASYFAFYAAFAALSLPGAWVVSVAGGALFGPWLGVPLVSLSSTVGATLAMLLARYLARDWVAARFPDFVAKVDRGVARDGLRWLFAARLTPVIPFFAVNLAAGLTRLPVGAFALVTMLGAFPFAALYALAGAQVATITRPSDVVSAPILAALLALAAAPFAVRGALQWRETRRRHEPLDPTTPVRLQPGGDRRRLGRAGGGLCRRDGPRARGADRSRRDGRRVPQHRLRAVQGADPFGQARP